MFDRVLHPLADRWGLEPAGDGHWQGCCPLCRDAADPSLHLWITVGTLDVACFRCGADSRAIVAALRPLPPAARKPHARIDA